MAKKKVMDLAQKMGFNTDGWQNLMVGLGARGTDKRENMDFVTSQILSRQELSDLWRGEGLAKKIVDIPAKDMVRAWFSIDGDTDNHIVKYLDKLRFRQAIKNGLRWSRLYGGSLVFIGIDDGQKYTGTRTLPAVREDTIKKVGFFRVYDRHQVSWESTDIDEDPTSENYGKPKYYTITPSNESTKIGEFKTHYSRVLRFDGEDLPESESMKERGWGDSCLQAPYTRIRGFASSLIASESIIEEFTIGVLSIKGLGDLIAAGKEKQIQERLTQIDMAKHILNTMLVDEDEEFTRISATVNGIKDILEFLKDNVSSESGIPQVKLFGEQSKGLGSQSAGNIRMYYDDILDMQEEDLRPQLERATKLVVSSQDFKTATKAKIKDTWHLKFNNLWQMSEDEIAKARNLQSQTDERYVKMGALTAEEVADSRYGSETYSFETKLDQKNKGKRKFKEPSKKAPQDATSSDPSAA